VRGHRLDALVNKPNLKASGAVDRAQSHCGLCRERLSALTHACKIVKE
jgi:hypothetical protein